MTKVTARYTDPVLVRSILANVRSAVKSRGAGVYPLGPLLADSRLSHRNIVVHWSQSIQKAPNGKTQPEAVLCRPSARMSAV